MATRYENLSGVSANYIDGTFASLSQAAAGQSIMLLGAAEKGLSGTPYLVQDLGAVSDEFGSASPLTVLASQVSDVQDANVFITRIGGKQSHFILERGIEGSAEREIILRISPVERGDAPVFENVKVALLPFTEGDTIRQRVVLFNSDTEAVIFDSEEVLSVDDSLFEVEMNPEVGEILFSKPASYTTVLDTSAKVIAEGKKDPRSIYTISDLESLSDLISANTIGTGNLSKVHTIEDVYKAGTLTLATLSGTFTSGTLTNFIGSKEGSGSNFMTHCERFAAIESAYDTLEDAGIDFMYCDGCYADVATIPASGLSSTEMSRWDSEYLGTAHKVSVSGQSFVTMFASPDPLNADHVVASTVSITPTVSAGSISGNLDIKVKADARELGLLLSASDLRIEYGASGEVEEYYGSDGRIKTTVKANLTATTAGVASGTTFFTAGTLTVAEFSISTKAFDIKLPQQEVDLTGMVADQEAAIAKYTTDVIASIDLKKLFKLNGDAIGGAHDVSKAVLTHYDLTGELVPDDVLDSLIEVRDEVYRLHEDAFAREVSFAHQAASMAYTSSTEYKATIAVVPTTRPRGGLRQLSRWAGKAPTYKIDNNGDLVVESNGTGFMGLKHLYGNAAYRPATSGTGLAYGGLMKNTEGFGIDSSKEELDSRGLPVDLGKHLLVVGAYGVVSVQGSGRSSSFAVSNLGPKLIQRLVELPVNEEPIGPINGVLPGVSTTGAISSRALLNDLALGRVVMIGADGSIANLRTAALPSSDYTRVSTIRAANLVCDAVRSVSLRYLGRAFSDAQLAALDAELAGTMRSLKVDGSIQDGSVRISASRADRINGRLNLKVQFVPPLSIEAITIDLTVSAPQA